MFKKEEWGLLWPFYMSYLLNALTYFVMPYFYIYFLEQGLSIFQVSIILCVHSIIHVIADIPTGAIADLYGRKFSVLLSYICTAVWLIIIPFSSNFYYLLAVFFSDVNLDKTTVWF